MKDICWSGPPGGTVWLLAFTQSSHRSVVVSTFSPLHIIFLYFKVLLNCYYRNKNLVFSDLECGMPADIVNGRLRFVNGTRQFQSIIEYKCDQGYVLVGRNELLCDVDQRWNGPPPRCEPVYCDEPKQIRNGAYKLSTNSTRFGTVVSYVCSSPRHTLVGPAKITCLKDGSYNTEPPSCVEANSKRLPDPVPQEPQVPLAPKIRKRPAFSDAKRPRPRGDNEDTGERRRPFTRVPFPKKPIEFSPESANPLKPKERPQRPQRPLRPVDRPRPPIDNEIPDSANVQNSPAGAEESRPVENVRNESRQAQLNLGE